MRTSRIRQEASVARPEFSKAAPEKNASPRMPNERMSRQVELATEASSSTTITSVDSIAFGATVVINLVALRGKVLLSFGTGERFTVHSSRPRKRCWAGECRSVVVAVSGMCLDGRLVTAKPNRHLRYSYPHSGDLPQPILNLNR
jgi:hypothetical protein